MSRIFFQTTATTYSSMKQSYFHFIERTAVNASELSHFLKEMNATILVPSKCYICFNFLVLNAAIGFVDRNARYIVFRSSDASN